MQGACVIRMVTPDTRIITTIAGIVGGGPLSGDGGPATLARLSYPAGIACDARDNVFVADSVREAQSRHALLFCVARPAYISQRRAPPTRVQYHSVVRMISTSTGIITTVAGTGVPGYAGDGGPATNALLNKPFDVAIDPATGNLFIADSVRVPPVAGTRVGSAF